jgi:polar amino acid transport system substrate-binding protein
MPWTRRQFLSATTVLGAALTTGCAQEITGSPTKDPDAKPASNVAEPEPARKKVNVAIIAYPPYTIEDGAELSGPVPDVARAVLGRLYVEDVQFQVVREEAQVMAALAAGTADFAGGLAIRPDLCANLSFSVPDYVSGTAFAVPAGNPKGLATYADVVGKNAKLAVWDGLPEHTDAVAAGVPAANLLALNDPVALLEAVRAGQADCFAFDELSLRELVRNDGAGTEVVDPFMPQGRLPLIGAYCFPKSASDMLPTFNNALRDLHESGDWGAMVAPFGLTEFNAPPDDLTAEKACAGG